MIPCFTERLQELKEKEKEAEYFTKMPSKHYMEIASLLLSRYKHGRMQGTIVNPQFYYFNLAFGLTITVI